MGRKKFFNGINEKDIYNRCYIALNNIRNNANGGYMLSPELSMATGFKQSQISKALQWGRRQFEEGNLNVTQWIMASPKGYFLPKDKEDERIFAYAIQNIKDIRSRARTQLPLYESLLRTSPESLKRAFIKSSKGKEDINVEMNPWAVWKAIIESEYIRPTTDQYKYSEDEDEDEDEEDGFLF